MRVIHYLLFSYLIVFASFPSFAWKVSLEPKHDIMQVMVENEAQLKQQDIYLVWVDKDATDNAFKSWTFSGWQEGIVPVSAEPLDLDPFETLAVTEMEMGCPEKHRCLLAMVAVPHGVDPTMGEEWTAASLLPLSVEAARRERLPGQQFFLPENEETFYNEAEMMDGDMPTTTAAPAAPESADKATDDSGNSGQAETEKPDIFKLMGSQLLFANGQAERFQIIDLSDLKQPRLISEMKLESSPREVYVLNDTIILLQTSHDESTFTVLQQSGNSLNILNKVNLKGRFIESRRRNNRIYVVMEVSQEPTETDGDFYYYRSGLQITALELNTQGQLTEIDKEAMTGYSPEIAIFSNYLVIANRESWRSTQVQTFDLTSETDALHALTQLNVPGNIPSEFHLNVKGQHLRLVYGPKDRKAGSTLAIYDLNTPKLDLIGKVPDIAPGEDLFATRFVDNRAFVVTYERQDPLWVIDLVDPTMPKILGELHIPGWSEKMFFHEDRIFAVGIHDQPEENEKNRWVRRVAMSLFDVADPTKPTLLDRFIPLVDKVTYSQSPALDDERALLLNWQQQFAAIPLSSWETKTNSHLQIVSIDNDDIQDAGLLNSPVELQRSLTINDNTLAALGDQALFTVAWEMGNPDTLKILGELELAKNVSQVFYQADGLYAAISGRQGFHKLEQYHFADLNLPKREWQLYSNYSQVMIDDSLAVFYKHSPLKLKAINLATGQVYPVQQLEAEQNPESGMIEPYLYRRRSNAFLQAGWFYIAEQRQLEKDKLPPHLIGIPEMNTMPAEWILRSWHIQTENAKEAPTRSIPGEPVGITKSGMLITKEYDYYYGGNIRLNLLALKTGDARLVASRQLECPTYVELHWTGNDLYSVCHDGYSYSSKEPVSTMIIKLDTEQDLQAIGQWQFDGHYYLRAINNDIALLSQEGGYYHYDDMMLKSDVMIEPAIAPMPPYYGESSCNIYRLIPENEPTLLTKVDVDYCPHQGQTALSEVGLWIAKGFAGIEVIQW